VEDSCFPVQIRGALGVGVGYGHQDAVLALFGGKILADLCGFFIEALIAAAVDHCHQPTHGPAPVSVPIVGECHGAGHGDVYSHCEDENRFFHGFFSVVMLFAPMLKVQTLCHHGCCWRS